MERWSSARSPRVPRRAPVDLINFASDIDTFTGCRGGLPREFTQSRSQIQRRRIYKRARDRDTSSGSRPRAAHGGALEHVMVLTSFPSALRAATGSRPWSRWDDHRAPPRPSEDARDRRPLRDRAENVRRVTFHQKRLRLAATVALVGAALPPLTWGYARTIDERLVFRGAPDPILLAFNGVASRSLPSRPLPSARRRTWRTSHSSRFPSTFIWATGSPIRRPRPSCFIFYLPWTFIATAVGAAIGYACGKVSVGLRSPAAESPISGSAPGVRGAERVLGELRPIQPPGRDRRCRERHPGLAPKSVFFTTEERLGALTDRA
jgi:hypothetical protein